MQKDYYVVKKSSAAVTWAYGLMIILAYIYPWINNSSIWMAGYVIEAVLCFFYILANGKIRVNRSVRLWLLTLLPIVVNSYSIRVHEYGYLITWCFLILLMIIAQDDMAYIKRMLYLLLGVCFIYAVSTVMINIGFSSAFEGIAASFRGGAIAQGTIKTAGLTSHYSHNGMYIAIGCLVMSAIFLMKPKKTWFNFLLMLVFYAALLLTQKRGPLIAVSIGVILTYFVARHESMSSKVKRIVTFTTATLATIYILYIAFPELFGIIDRFSSDNVLSNRGYLWDYALNMFKSSPLIGKGWGSYSHSLNLNIDSVGVSNQNAHNIYLQLLAETGVVGFLCFIIPIVYTLIRSVRLLQDMNTQGVDCTAIFLSVSIQIFFIVYGITGNPLYDKQMFLAYMLSVAFYLSYQARSNEYILSDRYIEGNLDESWNYDIQ